jgi:hypothetical protein
MKKRLIGSVAAVLAALALVAFGPAGPAHAGTWDETHCHNKGVQTVFGGYTVTLCVEVFYHTQDDGTGVTVSDIFSDVNNGCGNLDSPKLINQSAATYNDNHTPATLLDLWPQGGGSVDGDCHNHYSGVHLVGKDAGPTLFVYNTTENLNNAQNSGESFSFHICDGGGC